MEYLKKFNSNSDYESFITGSHSNPNVSLVEGEVKFNDLRNVVGSYVYKDLTIGNDPAAKKVIGVITIPAFATNDGKARWMPIDMWTENFDGYEGLNGNSVTSDSFCWSNNGNYQDFIDNLNDLHKVSKYPYINNGSTITNNIQGIGEFDSNDGSPYFVYMWTELSSSDKSKKDQNSTIKTSPNNSNLCYIENNSQQVGTDKYRVLPEPYLEDGSLNPIYKAYGTVTADWDHSNQTTVQNIVDDSSLFQAADNLEVEGISGGWYVPTMNEIIIMMAKFNTIKEAIQYTKNEDGNNREVYYNVSNNYYPWSSTFSYVDGGSDPYAVYGYLGDNYSYASWNNNVDNNYHPLFFRSI